jgi:hypothetical protein
MDFWFYPEVHAQGVNSEKEKNTHPEKTINENKINDEPPCLHEKTASFIEVVFSLFFYILIAELKII